MADSLLKRYSFDVIANDFMAAGKSSSAIKSSLKSLGIDSDIIRRIAIIAYEAELNIVIHSFGGKLHCDIYENKIVIISEDTGPGIADVDLAMKEGYSTASDSVRELGFGAGMGLPNIKKYSDNLKINTNSTGTRIEVTIYL